MKICVEVVQKCALTVGVGGSKVSITFPIGHSRVQPKPSHGAIHEFDEGHGLC